MSEKAEPKHERTSKSTSPDPKGTDEATSAEDTARPAAEAKEDLRASFREALARKQAKNSHPEDHLNGHSVGTGNNDTHRRQFRRKSG